MSLYLCVNFLRKTMDKAQLKLLQEFTNLCKTNPSLLWLPELAFYRDWLERFVQIIN